MKELVIKILSIVFLISAGPALVRCQLKRDIDISTVTEKTVSLTAGNTVVFETRNLSEGCNPVLNLISPLGEEVAADDNSGGNFASRITYRPVSSGNYTLIARARIVSSKGKADIYKNGVLTWANVSFGGTMLIIDNLRKNETMQTVRIPLGDTGNHRIYILNADAIGIYKRSSRLGTLGTAFIKLTQNLGAKMVVIGTDRSEGMVRLICNDAGISGHDSDHDGLGTELEKEIGLCSSKSGYAGNFDCSLVADPRDTDGDGIPDGWEVLGRNDVTPAQELPKWGANPRHKDLFIEVDFMRRTKDENTNNAILHMSVAVARHFAAVYGDSFTTLPLLKVYHATVLQNPDQIAGISTHLDIGIDPETPADATMFGNWGGFNAVDAVTSSSGYVGMNPNTAWPANMNKARLGIFRYALGYSGGGGSCGNNYACAFNFLDQSNAAHEWGHTMGLGHSGPYGATGSIDPNCKPNYASIMNYAYYPLPTAGFADGNGFPPLDNASLTEWKAVPPNNKIYLNVLQSVFKYWVDTVNGHVDWNRDGIFQPQGETVRAYANYKPGGDCEFTRYNQSPVGNANSTTTPVLVRLNNRLYIFYTLNGALKYRYSTSSWDCPQPVPQGCANGRWSTERDAGMHSVGVDAINEGNDIRVVSVQFNGKIFERKLSLILGMESWSASTQIEGSASGEPSLAYSLTASYLMYKGTDLFIHFNQLFAGHWQGDKIAQSSDGSSIKSTSDWAFPCIIQSYLSWNNGAKTLYALIPDVSARLILWYYDAASSFWVKSALLEGSPPGPIHSKPTMAYVPYKKNVAYPGRLYVGYITKSQPGSNFNGIARMKMSYVKVTANTDGSLTKEEKVGLDSYFDNSWFSTYGISFYYDPAHDSNLRSVFTSAPTSQTPFQISFRPKADGINDFSYKNYDDWDVLRVNLCQRVVNPGGLVINPVACPVR